MDIKEKYLFFNGKSVVYGVVELNSDGTISNYDNNNEKYWKRKNDKLYFLNKNKKITSEFIKIGKNYTTSDNHHNLIPYDDIFPFTQSVETYKTDKFIHGLLPIYENKFKFIKNNNIKLLEVGCLGCESIRYFLNYFEKGMVYGVDKNDISFTHDRFSFYKANQNNIDSLKSIADKLPGLDVVIDDGAHTYTETKNTFEIFWPKINKNGYYIIEDWDWMTDLITDLISSRGELGGGIKHTRGLKNVDLGIQELEVSTNDNRAYAIFKKR